MKTITIMPDLLSDLLSPVPLGGFIGRHRIGPGERTVFTIHKKAGETAKERLWAFNGGGRIRPSMAGRTDSSERAA